MDTDVRSPGTSAPSSRDPESASRLLRAGRDLEAAIGALSWGPDAATRSGDQPDDAGPTPEVSAVALEEGAAEDVVFLRVLAPGARDGRADEVAWRVFIDVREAVDPVVTAAAAAATAAMHPDAKLGTYRRMQ